jgi:hypothetical protein
LGGYPVVQPLLIQNGISDISMDKLRNIGMYQKWTSLGVYSMIGSPGSGIPEMLLAFLLISLTGSITFGYNTKALTKVRVKNELSDKKDAKMRRVDAYKEMLLSRNITSGMGVFGNGDSDITEIKGLRFVTVNCQVNDGVFLFGRLLVDSWAAIKLLFWRKGFESKMVIAILNKDKAFYTSEESDRFSSTRIVDEAFNEVVCAPSISPELTHIFL